MFLSHVSYRKRLAARFEPLRSLETSAEATTKICSDMVLRNYRFIFQDGPITEK